nr:MAG TPA: hypothetical protein [Caudoviricetes sp.]
MRELLGRNSDKIVVSKIWQEVFDVLIPLNFRGENDRF